jgi:hypothetical protein
MVKKTVIKRAYKLWPKTERLDEAVHYLNTTGGEGLADIEAEPAKVVVTPARDALVEAMAALPIEQQNYLRELGEEVTDIFNSNEGGAALAYDRIESDNLEGDQRLALWSVLPSNVRSGLKKEGANRKKPATTEAA